MAGFLYRAPVVYSLGKFDMSKCKFVSVSDLNDVEDERVVNVEGVVLDDVGVVQVGVREEYEEIDIVRYG